jgi:hypothetical protein
LNPAGSEKVANAAGLNNTVIEPGTPIYPTLAVALAGAGVVKISTFDKNFRPSYLESWDLNIQHSLTPSVIWQLGYVGDQGHSPAGNVRYQPGRPGQRQSS